LCGFRPRLMPWRDHVRMAQQLTQRLPDHRIEPISTHALGVALQRAANSQRRVPCALVVEIWVLFADAQLPDADHPQPARATCDERPQHRPPCRRPVPLTRGFSLALPWPLRVVTPLDSDHGRRVAPPPVALRARASPGLEITPLVCLPRAIPRDRWLPIVVTRLSTIDAMGQDVADCGRMPNLVLAGWRPRVSGMQPVGELTTAQVCFPQCANDISYDGGFHGLDHDLRRVAMTFRQLAVAVTTVRPWDECTVPSVLQPSATGAFGDLGALVRGDHPWHLREPCAWRTVANGILETDPWRVHRLERLDPEPLRRIVTGEPIRRQDDPGIEFAAPGRVPQTIQGRAVQPGPAEAISELFMRWQQRPALVLHVLLEHAPLALEGAVVWLMTGRDAGIEGYGQAGPPGVPE
jgi:hypothetical protein